MSAVQNLSGDDLLVVTGGAGFIGSHIVLDLAEAGWRVVVSDLLRSGGKWRNIARALLYDVVRPDMLLEWLSRHGDKVAAVIHMGAVSSTTEIDVDKFVATSTPLTQTWANTTVIEGSVPEFVAQLKQQPGGDIGVHGSIALTQSLLRDGLVDELRLAIAPVLHLRGRKLFDEGVPSRLTLTRHLASPAGYLLLDLQLDG